MKAFKYWTDGYVDTLLDGDGKTPTSGEKFYLASDVDARIAELEKALRQIHTGAAERSDGLSYEEIAEIADKALSL